jgi:3-isopropylmalate/(R)-2-methylmalate dehydratase small subunit
MEAFRHLDAVAVPLPQPNIDTDRIIPARFLSRPREVDHGQFLFHDARLAPDGTQNPDFPLNRPEWQPARIVVAGRNFACGSSRASAVWALFDAGFRCAIAPSFGDIFRSNGTKIGLLPVVLPAEVVESIIAQLEAEPGARIAVDLPLQTVTAPDGTVHPFEVDPFAKHCLLQGLDDFGLTATYEDEIAAFERRYGRENTL